MEMTSYEHGVPSWVDVSAPDPAAAAAFYSELFGWTVDEGNPEFGGYRNAQLRGRRVAGIGPQMAPGVPPVWSCYVNVDDAKAIEEKVRANGGQVLVEPMAVGEMGTMAVFMDPGGAAFGVWQPGQHTGAEIVNEPGSFGWSELVTDDVEGAIAFYEAVFGWGHETQDGPMPYTEWKLHGRSMGGMMPRPDTLPKEVPPYWGVYFIVEDCDATVAKVTELGGSVVMPAMDIEPGRMAVVADPAGAPFCVMKMKGDMGS